MSDCEHDTITLDSGEEVCPICDDVTVEVLDETEDEGPSEGVGGVEFEVDDS